ncbi:MAG: flagellar biosynthesis protein FlhF [Phycisphaeraceae bacterium]|nr:MAG: flagellar biosynthesis protein FlhF [Phycisphaeraceae bacterium]
MDLKTYRSSTMAGALAEVKKELGPDAVILRTRSFKSGGLLGFGGNSIVEITAAKDSPAAGTYTPRRRPAAPASSRPPIRERQTLTPNSPVGVDATPDAGHVLDRQVAAAADRATRRAAPVTQVALRPATADAHASLEAELASIKGLISQVLQTTRRTAVRVDGADAMAHWAQGGSDPLFDLYNRLIEHELPQPIVDELVVEVRDELSVGELADAAIVRETLLRRLSARIRVVGPCEPVGNGPIVEALIGPTGVGKTTTIAKLAATQKLRYGRSVGLITADTYRIAAVEQLRTYAGIIGVPLEVVLTPTEMDEARARLSSCDVVFVDTPGRSPRDAARLDQLAAFLATAKPSRTHLALSANSGPSVLRSAADRFGGAGADCLLLTKLDEAGGLGVIGHAAEATGLPLSYVTTGQEVPDHIEPAKPERLARLVLDGEINA